MGRPTAGNADGYRSKNLFVPGNALVPPRLARAQQKAIFHENGPHHRYRNHFFCKGKGCPGAKRVENSATDSPLR
ncbi:hypothetical protein TNIN_303521 [Trichonephila inaurata madagascariensis]|uniref:Uncharacterized protein n=1 Tax=Trichonephila inaurata madagascariensis TaxID=2747483 RepID=A0A8X6YMW2_9ARAC|nr:hypothetical protein TNIN_303521 [Trichonephila inaurata madagascariensis]